MKGYQAVHLRFVQCFICMLYFNRKFALKVQKKEKKFNWKDGVDFGKVGFWSEP